MHRAGRQRKGIGKRHHLQSAQEPKTNDTDLDHQREP